MRTVLSDLRDIRVIDRPEDRHAYLSLRYETGVEVPSRMASDGTMRLLALTLPAYLPDNREICLLEETENGVHPLAVEGICHSLSSLSRNGWEHRARAVVIDPELEAWAWSASHVVATALGWGERYDELRLWLSQRGILDDALPKPSDPKRAMTRALRGASRATRRRRSPRIFGEIAANAPVERCEDPALGKLMNTLREWFSEAGP